MCLVHGVSYQTGDDLDKLFGSLTNVHTTMPISGFSVMSPTKRAGSVHYQTGGSVLAATSWAARISLPTSPTKRAAIASPT